MGAGRPAWRFLLVASLCALSVGSCSPGWPGRQPEEVRLAEDWVTAVLEGDLQGVTELTFGEFGEPQAILEFARRVSAYSEEYPDPIATVASGLHAASSPELSFVCVRFDFTEFVLEGGLTFRSWDDLGLRVWEFRDGMEACTSTPGDVTTTRPELPSEP